LVPRCDVPSLLLHSLRRRLSDSLSLVISQGHCFSPNGRVVVSAGEDNSVKIWSVDNQQELAMLVFQKNGNQYAGVTFDNRTFGDRNSGLLSVYIDGKQASPSEVEQGVQYIGRGIVIMENQN